MRLIKILFLISSVFCDRVYDQIFKVMVNDSVDPCDNFYQHVCGFNPNSTVFTVADDIVREEFFDRSVFDEVSEYLVEIIKGTENPYTGFQVSDALVDGLYKACSEGREYLFIAQMEKVFNVTANETLSCELYSQTVETYLSTVNNLFIENYQAGCEVLLPDRIGDLFWHRYRDSASRIKYLLERIKETTYKLVANTVWINVLGLGQEYDNQLNTTFVTQRKIISENFDMLFKKYSDCKKQNKHFISDEDVIRKICIRETFQFNTNTMKSNWKFRRMNTRSKHEYFEKEGRHSLKLAIPHYVFADSIKSEALFYGLDGFTMGHELVHSITTEEIPELNFTREGISCVTKQIKKSCKVFTEPDCETEKNTYLEDVSDFLGSHLSLETIKHIMGKEFYEISKVYGNIPNNKLFYYGHGAVMCKDTVFRGNHLYSSYEVRLNAVVAQSSEFKKAFNCSSESKMMKSLHKRCHLLGEHSIE